MNIRVDGGGRGRGGGVGGETKNTTFEPYRNLLTGSAIVMVSSIMVTS